jgi:hypothetical protein
MGSAGAEQKDDLCRSSDRWSKESKKEMLVATFLFLTSRSPYKLTTGLRERATTLLRNPLHDIPHQAHQQLELISCHRQRFCA